MTRQRWLELGIALSLATGIIVTTAFAARTSDSAWLVLAGPLFLALAVVGADVLASRLRGEKSRPAWGAMIVGASLLAACAIVASRDPELVATTIPIVGAGAAVTPFLRSDRRCKAL